MFLWYAKAIVQRYSVKKVFLKNFAKFNAKCLCQGLFFNKVTGLRPATLLKKRLWHRCIPVNFTKFLKTPFFIEHFWWLLLGIVDTHIIELSLPSSPSLKSFDLDKDSSFKKYQTLCSIINDFPFDLRFLFTIKYSFDL